MAQKATQAATGASSIDRKLINKLTEGQMARFREHTPTSAEYFDRARKVMPGGVPSSFQLNDPWPVYIERGEGALVWDVDDSEYVDFHNGFGVMCIGHANPKVGAAVTARHKEGTHFAAPTNGSIVVAENLAQALRPAAVAVHQLRHRVDDGRRSTSPAGPPDRDGLIKVEGSYHGHHDAVMVSAIPNWTSSAPATSPIRVPFGVRLPEGASSS